MRTRALAAVLLVLALARVPSRADEAAPAAPPAAPPPPRVAPASPPSAVPAASAAKPFRPGVRALFDVAYATVGGRALTLDLYLPATSAKAPRPLLVWVHGGGWIGGDKRPCPSVGFVPTGWVVASVGYRLSTTAPFPAQIHDVKAAIRFLRAHAAAWGIDPDRFAAVGASAGGHLAALLGASGGVAGLEGDVGTTGVSSAVQAVVDVCGPTDLTRFDGHGSRLVAAAPDSVVARLLGGPLAERLEVARAANPITYVDRRDPPFLILHGDADDVVPLDQSRRLAVALLRVGVPVTLVVVPGAGHAIPGTEARVARFLAGTLGAPRTGSAEATGAPSGAPDPAPAGMGSSR